MLAPLPVRSRYSESHEMPEANWTETNKPTAPVPRKRRLMTWSAARLRRRQLRTQLIRLKMIRTKGLSLLERKTPQNLPARKLMKWTVCRREA